MSTSFSKHQLQVLQKSLVVQKEKRNSFRIKEQRIHDNALELQMKKQIVKERKLPNTVCYTRFLNRDLAQNAKRLGRLGKSQLVMNTQKTKLLQKTELKNQGEEDESMSPA